jgi:hypothetical protein
MVWSWNGLLRRRRGRIRRRSRPDEALFGCGGTWRCPGQGLMETRSVDFQSAGSWRVQRGGLPRSRPGARRRGSGGRGSGGTRSPTPVPPTRPGRHRAMVPGGLPAPSGRWSPPSPPLGPPTPAEASARSRVDHLDAVPNSSVFEARPPTVRSASATCRSSSTFRAVPSALSFTSSSKASRARSRQRS